ncbi:unnamed protein product [Echinostoma caproni]|uniref:DNA excision repair protein ERCC-6-like n=1 Tax=Echinostoma caproni TaxID=27848 RepID=A0A183AAC2_9TREM|nr:unnamed protein product [Echinostoma caproni]
MSVEDEFQSLISSARIVFEQGDPHESLKICQKALDLKECPKLRKKIERIRAYIASQEKENMGNQCENSTEDPVKEVADHLFSKAQRKIESGDLEAALKLLKESYECYPSQTTAKRIAKVEKSLNTIGNEAEDVPRRSSVSEVSEELDPEQMVEEARQLYHNGQLRDCVQLLQRVQSIAPSEKIQRKIDRIETFLRENRAKSPVSDNEDLSSNDLVTVAEGFYLPHALYKQLYSYQRDGVQWLWKLHNSAPGGVLADDMGLGKTVQVISFLCGLFLSSRKSFTALVAMPVSVLVTWESELKRWAPALRVCVFHDANRQTRLRHLASIQRQGGILLTTYGMVTSNIVDLTTDLNADPHFLSSAGRTAPDERHGPEFQWNYLVLDEAHKIKNPAAKTTKAILTISAKHRILLTGTAVQNNLAELWSLYNCTHSGRLLGRMQTFKTEYEKPITRAREKDASRAERAHGQLMAQSLRKLIDPYFLRRTKAEVLPSTDNTTPDQLEVSLSKLRDLQLNEAMPKKTELVIWLYLREIQERSYRDFLQLDQVKELLLRSNRRSPLMELIILKKLCDHPRLLSRDQCLSLNLEVNQAPEGQFSKHYLPSASQLMNESGKLYFLGALMNSFLCDAEQETPYPPRTLIFSQSLRLLDMAEKVILSLNKRPENVAKSRFHRVLRLDGRLSKVEERLEVIRMFERDKSYTVGGVGLTLTAANRVVILDPSWNPATDAQAVDRAYRIGQKSNVLVYRLITCATVEEKIYRRQIFKDSVIRQTTSSGRNKSDHDPYRYFTHQDLRELFTLADPRVSATQEQLSQLHEAREKWDDQWLSPHLAYLTGDEMRDSVFGLSFHDLMFSRQEVHEPVHPATEDEARREQEFLRNRMAAAEFAIARECGGLTAPHPVLSLPPDMNNNSGAPAYRPPDGVFVVPSMIDSRRPMLNRPHLGLPTARSLTQTTLPWMTQPPVEHTQPDGVADLIDQFTTSLREMSISHADSPPVTPNTSAADQTDSCVIIEDPQDVSHKLPENASRETTDSNSRYSAQQNSPAHPTQRDSTTANCVSQPSSSSVHSTQTPSGKSASGRSSMDVNSPWPSSAAAFLGAIKSNVFRSTPVSLRTAPQPMLLGTPVMNPRKSAESPSTPSIHMSADTTKSMRNSLSPTKNHSPIGLSSSSSSESSHESSSNPIRFTKNGMLIDITVEMDEERLQNTMAMKSLHEILAKSGLHTPNEQVDRTGSQFALETIEVEDSCLSASQNHINPVPRSTIDDSLDEVEVIGDSLDE